MWRSEDLRCHFQKHHLLPLRWSSLLGKTDWPPSPRDLTVSVPGFYTHAAMPSIFHGSGDQTEVLIHIEQVLYRLSHLCRLIRNLKIHLFCRFLVSSLKDTLKRLKPRNLDPNSRGYRITDTEVGWEDFPRGPNLPRNTEVTSLQAIQGKGLW